MPRRPFFCLSVLALSISRAALAAPPAAASSDPAQALFDRGVADMEAGQFEKACPAIEASQHLDPRPGTLFALAECEAGRGRLATATRYYSEYLALYRTFSMKRKLEQQGRKATSEAQLLKLEPLVPKLTLTLEPNASPDVIVKRDGNIVADLSLGTALPVDPGEHMVTTQVPGSPEVEHRVTLYAGESKALQLKLRSVPLLPTATGSVSGPAPSVLLATAASADPRTWRIGAWSAGAVAVVGFAVGAVTGILAVEQRDIISRNCHPENGKQACNATGFRAASLLDGLATASTVGIVTGGVSAVVGVTLLIAAPSSPTPSPSVGRSQALAPNQLLWGIRVGGKF